MILYYDVCWSVNGKGETVDMMELDISYGFKFSSVENFNRQCRARISRAVRPSSATPACGRLIHKNEVPPPFVQSGHTFQRDAISATEIAIVDSHPTTLCDLKRLSL